MADGNQSLALGNPIAGGAPHRSCLLLQHTGTPGVDNIMPYYLANQTWIHLILIMNQTNGVLAGVSETARLA